MNTIATSSPEGDYGHDMRPLYPGQTKSFPQTGLVALGTLTMLGPAAAGLVETQDVARAAFQRRKRSRYAAFWRAPLAGTPALDEAGGGRQ